MRKLKHKEIKIVRDQLMIEQNGLCALCNHDLDGPCLDHNHKSGVIRKVLCRGCNSLLGKIENNLARSKMTPDKLKNFLNNAEDYIQITSDLIHPTYKKPF